MPTPVKHWHLQDAYAIESYRRAEEAVKNGLFDAEIAPVSVPSRRGDPTIVDADEEWNNIKHDKVDFSGLACPMVKIAVASRFHS